MNRTQWDMVKEYVNSEIDDDENLEVEEEYITPTIDTSPQELEHGEKPVEYVTRGPRDVVVSGRFADASGWGPGRVFNTRGAALIWAIQKYGKDRVKPVKEQVGRWGFLIKNLKA